MSVELLCTVCGESYRGVELMTCPACGPWGILEVVCPLERPVGEPGDGMRRWLPLLPVDPGMAMPELVVGDTPLVEAPRLARHLEYSRFRIKDEGRNPSGSLKDRPSWVGAVLAQGRTVACASTGNAASSLAVMCASMGTPAVIFVPDRAPEPKLAQLTVFGARVFRVLGSYDATYDLCTAVSERMGWYSRSAAVNPYLVEGKKTCGLELGEVEPADWVSVSVGDGCTIAGIWKGLKEMYSLGILDRLPRLLGVQAEKAPAVYQEWAGGNLSATPRAPAAAIAETLADSISVGVPRNWRRAVRAVQESGGEMILVSESEIDEAMRMTARLGGVYAEPAGATAIAGLARARLGGSVIAVASGSGLKDVDGATRAGG
ncbi:MAG: pyridoxal-phosphate dependent enzyme, partial [Myxococcota bacterium]|nr:pyridoxal-phosphate dependent enzyme [Myxococcota bacterium]